MNEHTKIGGRTLDGLFTHGFRLGDMSQDRAYVSAAQFLFGFGTAEVAEAMMNTGLTREDLGLPPQALAHRDAEYIAAAKRSRKAEWYYARVPAATRQTELTRLELDRRLRAADAIEHVFGDVALQQNEQDHEDAVMDAILAELEADDDLVKRTTPHGRRVIAAIAAHAAEIAPHVEPVRKARGEMDMQSKASYGMAAKAYSVLSTPAERHEYDARTKDAPLELVFPRMFDLSRERELVKAMRIVTCHLPDPAVKSEFGQRIAEMAAEYGVKVDAVKAARRPYLAIHRLFTELGASAREDMRLFGRNEPKHEAFRWFNEARERLLSGIFNLVMSVSQMRTNDLVELVRSGKMDEKTARGRLKYELHVAKARFSRRDVSNVEQAKSRFESAIRQAMPSATPSKGLRPAAPKPQQSTATADDRYRASLRANEPAPRRRPRRNRRPRHGATRRPTASK